jgi:hypothetical protein
LQAGTNHPEKGADEDSQKQRRSKVEQNVANDPITLH